MKDIKRIDEVLHRVKVRLFPSNLPEAGGACTARVKSEAALSIEGVCAALKTRGGFSGNYEELVMHVKQFLEEAAY